MNSARRVDIAIVGCGPAGIQAAITAVKRKMDVLLLGKPDGSSLKYAHIDDYFGVLGPIEGIKLLGIGLKQAESKNVEIIKEDVVELSRDGLTFKLKTESGIEIIADAVILAMGARRNRLNVKGEDKLVGRGVSYCAECDCSFFRGLNVAVVGDGSAAAYAALLMASYASKVFLIARRVEFSSRLFEELGSRGVIMVEGRRVVEILGERRVEGVLLDDGSRLDVQGVFIELGSRGVLELTSNVGLLPDASGYLKVDRHQATDIEGIFACGDLCGPPLSLAKSVGEGYVAAVSAFEYVRSKRGGK
ncbi:NAD(P)/FAD-dependent oxidoreductase [Candidatus Bathyarchaeota archaeon]|nr:NAD(P)/FAD-dependent oxidoreductase [Candidatus Bathyarchaeota archaeon]